MIFNSYIFIFLFLPATLGGFYAIGHRAGHRPAVAWLVGASLFFYGWWNPAYLGLIVGSILFNYAVGLRLVAQCRVQAPTAGLLALGIGANLAVLGYFKYANFFIGTIDGLTGLDWQMAAVVLPLGISFFTFQKIAFLADCANGRAKAYDFLDFCLFVLFFPQLIAGPIVHHKDVMPQFARAETYRLRASHIAVGATIFVIGLFKKVILADGVAADADRAFAAVAAGEPLTMLAAWHGALAYTVQLYFDFSGYSDMAIGLARMFGIRLPLNFNSPYKATSIIDFWRRWHMTLSRFLRDYLYIPLGGNRHGPARRHLNLLATMVLGGLWHGAAWTFVLWGALHGLYLGLNHLWLALRRRWSAKPAGAWESGFGRAATFVAVVVGWVFFRAADVDAALLLLQGMAGQTGMALPVAWGKSLAAVVPADIAFAWKADGLGRLVLLLALCWFLPNTQEIMARYRPALDAVKAVPRRFAFKPNPAWAAVVAVLAVISVFHLNRVSAFLYFQF